ncbi:Hypothetical_protein [Hexamita inflata]|uniref:Hypothetical_protein n=1 Tax=Hexamita inflata TaxID=28002 RepID=A0AA86PTM2_9EUKA|nr:Hypothetical protein HINF_LOCUS28374 [Hexamita inflata]
MVQLIQMNKFEKISPNRVYSVNKQPKPVNLIRQAKSHAQQYNEKSLSSSPSSCAFLAYCFSLFKGCLKYLLCIQGTKSLKQTRRLTISASTLVAAGCWMRCKSSSIYLTVKQPQTSSQCGVKSLINIINICLFVILNKDVDKSGLKKLKYIYSGFVKLIIQWFVTQGIKANKYIIKVKIIFFLKFYVQIAFQRKATPDNRKQDSQFMTLFPGLNLEQIRNNANTITHNSPTQPKAVINKKIYKQTPLARKSQRRFCEEV